MPIKPDSAPQVGDVTRPVSPRSTRKKYGTDFRISRFLVQLIKRWIQRLLLPMVTRSLSMHSARQRHAAITAALRPHRHLVVRDLHGEVLGFACLANQDPGAALLNISPFLQVVIVELYHVDHRSSNPIQLIAYKVTVV